tara:strand:- start:315 stop:785 length:471 start_codon:yes stop_codon:yes gene_type:complete
MLSHISKNGKAVMVNVKNKIPSHRIAKAQAIIKVPKSIYDTIIKNDSKKGDIIGVSRIAGIIATKKTSDLIPLCHQVNLDSIKVDIHPYLNNEFKITSEIQTTYKTGVEMEALMAVSIASLTFYDMCKALSHDIIITDIKLIKKTGGKSDYLRKTF